MTESRSPRRRIENAALNQWPAAGAGRPFDAPPRSPWRARAGPPSRRRALRPETAPGPAPSGLPVAPLPKRRPAPRRAARTRSAVPCPKPRGRGCGRRRAADAAIPVSRRPLPRSPQPRTLSSAVPSRGWGLKGHRDGDDIGDPVLVAVPSTAPLHGTGSVAALRAAAPCHSARLCRPLRLSPPAGTGALVASSTSGAKRPLRIGASTYAPPASAASKDAARTRLRSSVPIPPAQDRPSPDARGSLHDHDAQPSPAPLAQIAAGPWRPWHPPRTVRRKRPLRSPNRSRASGLAPSDPRRHRAACHGARPPLANGSGSQARFRPGRAVDASSPSLLPHGAGGGLRPPVSAAPRRRAGSLPLPRPAH